MSESRAVAAASRLRAALDAVAGALSASDTSRLVAAEAGLASVLADLGGVVPIGPDDRLALGRELARARAALARCRILGASVSDLWRLALAAQGLGQEYDRAGRAPAAPAASGGALKARL